ncbi:MAG: hypothetical protein M3Q07_11145 [Pseudobdellovibrionaceae bacterium]|nr:hypothetical protein [Pseudobdellovibrionaceae bacterium]
MLKILEHSSFFQILQSFDEDMSNAMKALGCKHCGGKLDIGHYQRKPRGLEWADLTDVSNTRYSLCCREESCRRRSTPLSLRFAGRKVYCSVFIVLFTLMQERGDQHAQLHLHKKFGLSLATARGWVQLFKSRMPSSSWAKDLQSRGIFRTHEPGLLGRFFESIDHSIKLTDRWQKFLIGIAGLWVELIEFSAG